MKKEYIIPKAVIARVNGQEDILKSMDLIGGSIKGDGNMAAKERIGNFDDSDDDFWSTKSDE